jgi:hypothetical protein
VVIRRDPAKARQALTLIETSSRQAVLELHRLLGFLRQEDDPDDLAPQPGLGQLPRLAATMSDSELTVEVRIEGEPRPLAATVDVSAYRIVQEPLTNTLKHAGASRADVHLRYRPEREPLLRAMTDATRGRRLTPGEPAPTSGAAMTAPYAVLNKLPVLATPKRPGLAAVIGILTGGIGLAIYFRSVRDLFPVELAGGLVITGSVIAGTDPL